MKFFAKLLLALTVVFYSVLPACCQQIEQVNLLDSNGTVYEVIEVIDHKWERRIWQHVLGVGGRKKYTFRLHKNDYPLTVYADKLPKDFKIPDKRKYFVRHPRQEFAVRTGVQTGLLIYDIVR